MFAIQRYSANLNLNFWPLLSNSTYVRLLVFIFETDLFSSLNLVLWVYDVYYLFFLDIDVYIYMKCKHGFFMFGVKMCKDMVK